MLKDKYIIYPMAKIRQKIVKKEAKYRKNNKLI